MNDPGIPEAVERAAEVLRDAEAVLVGAGAGMGVDSGLPDFRGPEGFWRAFPALKRRNLDFHMMAKPGWFEDDPGLAWAFYGHRLNLYRQTKPHAGFDFLRRIGLAKPGGLFVFTSNVDGQFQKAGFSSESIAECHGSIHHLQCSRPCTREIWSADDITIHIDEATFTAVGELPTCKRCGDVARPNILMFGDFRWVDDRSDLQQAGFQVWRQRIQSEDRRIAIVEVGAGTAIPTVRYVCERTLTSSKAKIIRINLRQPEVPAGQVGLGIGAAPAMRLLSERLFSSP